MVVTVDSVGDSGDSEAGDGGDDSIAGQRKHN